MRTVAAHCRGLNADPRPDGELLAAFTSGAGAAETAFTELVRRHGPLVWGTCRRLLPDPADAEDAFQAAFLVLLRRGGQLTRYPCVGPWLHRVTVWTARNVRRKNARRHARQTDFPDHVPASTPTADPDLSADLDAALLALPSRYRDSIILCHLLGFTRREAAERTRTSRHREAEQGCGQGRTSAGGSGSGACQVQGGKTEMGPPQRPARRGAGDARSAAEGARRARIEVVVVDGPAPGTCRVREYGRRRSTSRRSPRDGFRECSHHAPP